MTNVYLDFQASTPLDPKVLDTMLPWLREPGNPHASENAAGRRAQAAVDSAREQIAMVVGAAPDDVIFTSGATEAVNIVLRSLIPPAGHIAISAIEHACVRATAEAIAREGGRCSVVPVNSDGLVDLGALSEILDDDPDLVSLMWVNNEIGTIQPVAEAAGMCREAGVPLHSDAAQAVGRVPVKIGTGVEVVTLSGHKVYGPQGIGAIVATPALRARLRPLLHGGGQQGGIRPGTLPIALCVGFGAAVAIAEMEMERDRLHVLALRERFLAGLRQRLGGVLVNGSLDERVPHNLNISIPGISADELLARTPRLELSTGSACASGAIEPSRVLAAMGIDGEALEGAVRVGFGRSTTADEVDFAVAAIADAVHAAAAQSVVGAGA